MDKRIAKIVSLSTIAIAGFYTSLFFLLSIPRLFYPYEIEWMEGSILDHAVRIVEGKQLYVHPTIHFVDWLYQPLYYYATAAAMDLFGIGYFAGRIVSMLSTLGSAALIYFIIRRVSQEKLFSPLMGFALFFASFAFTGYSYDIARVDALLTFLVISATYLCLRSSNIIACIGCAFFFVLAFFTKQQAIFYVIPLIVWIALRSRKQSLLFGSMCLILTGIGIAFMRLSNGQWYQYFVFTVPRAKAQGFGWLSTMKVFPYFVFGAWTMSSFSILIYFILSWKNGLKNFFSSSMGLLAMLFLTSIVQVGMHLGDQMAYKNIALPFVCFSSILFPIAIKDIRRYASPILSDAMLFALPIQFIALFYNPLHDPLAIITSEDQIAGKNFVDSLKAYPGDILMPVHGLLPRFAQKETFANELAMHDVYTVGDSISVTLHKEWNDALHNRRYSAIILDDNPYRPYDSLDGYEYIMKINMSEHPFKTVIGNNISTPRYLYLPKLRPLAK